MDDVVDDGEEETQGVEEKIDEASFAGKEEEGGHAGEHGDEGEGVQEEDTGVDVDDTCSCWVGVWGV